MPKKRESIAFVACEPCRRRKVKCDGFKPVCGRCVSGNASCSYTSDPTLPRSAALKAEREQLQTKYDNLLHLYTRLRKRSAAEAPALLELMKEEEDVLEEYNVGSARVPLADNASWMEHAGQEFTPLPDSQMTGQSSRALAVTTLREEVYCLSALPLPTTQQYNDTRPGAHWSNQQAGQKAPANISVSHRVMLWPAAYPLMLSGSEKSASDLRFLSMIGSPWLLGKDMSRHTRYLPCDVNVPCHGLQSGAVIFSDLSVQQVDIYSAAYFNTFNRLFPLLDPDLFADGVVARVLCEGYKDDDPESVLALLVFALGCLAHDSVRQDSTQTGLDGHSGFRGGTVKRPSGLGLFNEARRRLGLIRTRCCLENVQVLLLEATYFEACARHSDFWSSINAACMSCIFLVQSQANDWSSQYGDLVKRAFWTCLLHERSFSLEFGTAVTGIETLADLVPMPHFPKLTHQKCPSSCSNSYGNMYQLDSHYAYHFSAMISLGRLIRRADDVIKQYEPIQIHLIQVDGNAADYGHNHAGDDYAFDVDWARGEGYQGSPPALIQALIAELDSWRHALPEGLSWRDESRFDFESLDPLIKSPRSSLFSFLQDTGPDMIDQNTGISVAHLRTCYYQARFLIYRPFVYKALHQRGEMTVTDRKLCGFAINAACLWPISLSPPSNKKHLIPHLFSWTQNFLAMLLILKICQKDDYLSKICRKSDVAEDLVEKSISSMKAWLEDVSQVDGIAEWGIGLHM